MKKKPSEIFEGPESSLRKAYDGATHCSGCTERSWDLPEGRTHQMGTVEHPKHHYGGSPEREKEIYKEAIERTNADQRKVIVPTLIEKLVDQVMESPVMERLLGAESFAMAHELGEYHGKTIGDEIRTALLTIQKAERDAVREWVGKNKEYWPDRERKGAGGTYCVPVSKLWKYLQ